MSGQNLLVRDLRIVQFGPNSAVTDRVIVQIADSAAGRIARNCVVERAIFDDAGDYYAGASVILVKLAGVSQSAPHEFCVVRQCVFNGEPITPPGSPPEVYPVTGINPGLGRGFIAEENQMHKLTTGIKLTNAGAIDLIFWNNEMDVVRYGIDLAHNDVGTAAVGRVVMIENAINLARIPLTECRGIRVIGDPFEQNFRDVIIRRNVIAPDPESAAATADLHGIVVHNTTNALVEQNVLDRCDGVPFSYTDCIKLKAFNNQKPDGTLLRAYNSTAGQTGYLQELQDYVEDSLIGF